MQPPPSVSVAAFDALRQRPLVSRLLAQVAAAFGGIGPVASCGPDVVAARLDALRGPLSAHFEDVERSASLGRFVTAEADCVDGLRSQHRSLLSRLDHLRTVPAIDRRGAWWPRAVRGLVDDLQRHTNELARRACPLEPGAAGG